MTAVNDALLVRRLGADDLDAWHRLRLEMLEREPRAFGDSYEEAAARPVERFLDHLTNPYVAVFGAFSGGVLAGSACFGRQANLKSRHKGVLWGVYVRTDSRRGRLGEALVQAVIDHARKTVDILLAVVAADNDPARALYRRLGFVTYGIERRGLRVDGRDYDDELIRIDFR